MWISSGCAICDSSAPTLGAVWTDPSMYDAVVAPYDRRGKKMPIDILLVEDNEGDIRLIREILGAVNPTACLHVVTDGAEAMNFLRYQGPYADAPRPNVIVMDL